MDTVRLRKLEEKECILRDTFADALLSLERNSEVSLNDIRLMKALAQVWMASRELVECERKAHPAAANAIKLKEQS